MKFLFATIVIVAAGFSPALAATIWYRNDELKVAVAYDNTRWRPAAPAERTTLFVVNWEERSGGLVATCYLQSLPSAFASAIEGAVHENREEISSSLMSNLRKRDPDAVLVGSEATWADNFAVVRLERRFTTRSLDRESTMTADALFTSWRGNEVLLECAYDDVLRQDQTVHQFVRGEITKILRTLHFKR